jgi:hypothetical protein
MFLGKSTICVILFLSGIGFIPIIGNKAVSQTLTGPGMSTLETVLVWNANATGADSVDQLSFQNVLEGIGLTPGRLNLRDLGKSDLRSNMLIILPHSSVVLLTDRDIERILQIIGKGARVISDGDSRLSHRLGIQLSAPTRVFRINDLVHPSVQLNWPDAPSVPGILSNPDETIRVLYADSQDKRPLGILKTLGSGKVLFFSPEFDPLSGQGYSRFPDLPDLIISLLHCRPLFRRHGADAYFDPGYKWGVPAEKLVSDWKKWGIKAVHAGVWCMYDEEDPDYNFKQLIREAHKNGIAVYVWIEWPYVGNGFWDKHPEWREKNALLQGAKLSFLYLMDLQNPDCMRAALGDLFHLLEEDWDGIDIAEFSITGGVSEALGGPAEPWYFTGFNAIARKEFKTISGFDPAELFDESSPHYWKTDSAGLDKFYQYRVLVNNRLIRQVVSSIDSVRRTDKRDWEFILTVLDNSLHPEFDRLLGFDRPATIRLAGDYHATLQVEDPASEWSRPPCRYEQLANTYLPMLGHVPLAIDINIVPDRPDTVMGIASLQPTGSEMIRMFRYADNTCSRVCFYAESTVYEHDWEIFPYAMASGTSGTYLKDRWRINTPHTVIMQSPGKERQIFLDGKPWPFFNKEGITIPKGEHVVSFGQLTEKSGRSRNSLYLSDISDELISCTRSNDGIRMVYQSPARCFITCSRRPTGVKVDGTDLFLPGLNSGKGYVIIAPSGKHELQLY